MNSSQYVIVWLGVSFLSLVSCNLAPEPTTSKPSPQAVIITPTGQPGLTELHSATPAPTTEFTPIPQPIMLAPSHPYLLFDRQDIAQFKRDIDQPGNFRRELFSALEDYLLKAESSSMIASTFFYQLTGDPALLAQARNMLLEKAAQDCWDADGEDCLRDRRAANDLGRVSLAYDWLYLELSPADRDQVKARIATEVCRLYEAFTYGINNTAEGWANWWLTDYTQNHFHSVTGGLILGALAIKDDHPPTCTATNKDGQQATVTNQQILDFGLQKMEQNYLIFNRIADGSYPEGDSYVVAYGETYLSALWATQRLLSPDLIKEERFRMFPLFYLYNAPPGQLWNQLTNHGDYYTSSRENYWFPKDLHLSATVNRNPLASWLAEQYYYTKDDRVRIPSDNGIAAINATLDFIFLDPTLEPQSPTEANLDLSYHASDWEGVFVRSDWSDTAVAAALKVGPPGGHTAYNIARSNQQTDQLVSSGQESTKFDLVAHHMHPDANGLYLYANKTFLLPEMPGYLEDQPWGRHTSSHNTILVSDSWGQMRGQIQGDDIGGTTFDHKPWKQGHEYFWGIETPESEVGIIEHTATQGYDYSLGQATSAYWPELGLKRFHRHVFFVRDPGYLLVVDDLDATADKTYDWMGHSTGTVTQEDQWLKVYADNEQRLGIAVLSPPNFSFVEPTNEWQGIKLEDIYGFRYISENQTMYEWSIRQACQTCRFITLLFPTDETHWRQKPIVTQLADTDQLAAVRVNFESINRTDTLAVSLTPGQTLTVAGLTFNGRVAAIEKIGSTVRRVLLIHGSTLTEGNTTLIENLPASSFLEAHYNGDTLLLRGSSITGATLFAPEVTAVLRQTVDKHNVITTRPITFTRSGDYITLDAGGE